MRFESKALYPFLPLDYCDLVSLKELKDFLRLEHNELDDEITELLKSGVNLFQNTTNRVLLRQKALLSVSDERVFLAPFNAILKADFKGSIDTKGDVFSVCGSGSFELDLGYENIPFELKSWLKNYVLNAFENKPLPRLSDVLLNRYKIRFF